MTGGDPFVCARAFIEDNALCLLNFLLLSAASYTALYRAAELEFAASKNKKPSETDCNISEEHAALLAAIRAGDIKPFRVCCVINPLSW